MALYALKRFGAVLIILVIMSVLVFLATHALPTNTAQMILGQYATPATQAALEHKLGLDLPLATQYWRWATGILHGDLGQSLVMERPIGPVLWDALGKSAVLAVAAMAIVIDPGFGARRHRRRAARAVGRISAISIFAYLGLSVPEF